MSDNQHWPHLIEKALHHRGYDKVEVLNAGVVGYSSFDSFSSLYSGIWMFKPDYVLLYNAWNDIKYFSESVHLTPAGGQRVAEIVTNVLSEELRLAKDQGERVDDLD